MMPPQRNTCNPIRPGHKEAIESLYSNVRFPNAIDWWTAHYAQSDVDVAISNARHLDPTRQAIENEVWRRIVPVGGQVLDLACGRGFFSQRLRGALDGAVRIIGVDLSETILRVAQVEQEGMPLVLGNAERLPFTEGAFDVVLAISTFEHMEEPRPIIEEIYRVLKPQGYLYISLHKPFLDPFIVPSLAKRFFELVRRRDQRDIPSEYTHIGYKGPLRELRRNLQVWLSGAGFEWVESRALLHQLEWGVYKKVIPGAVPGLVRIGRWLNRLPFTYYKNLEYWLLRKS